MIHQICGQGGKHGTTKATNVLTRRKGRLKKHLVDGVAISEVCDEHELQPNQFYTWQRHFFENCAAAFASEKPGVKERQLAKKVEKLEQKLVRKDEVIAEIGEEYVKLKKELGEP